MSPSGAPAPGLEGLVERIRALGSGARIVVLAGPGVPAAGPTGVDGLRELAETAGLGVVNTWGAKGLFDWQSPHHLGTAGLQERDFELAGLGDADLILATGLDSHEAPPDRWQLAPHAWVRPRTLGALARAWPLPPATPERPPLYTDLAAVVQPLYASDAVPLSPARAVVEVQRALGDDGVVVADAGLAGFWVARAFPTSRLGSVMVPSIPEPGFAAWGALQAARSGRRAVAVTVEPYGFETDDALAYAAATGVGFVLCVWGAGATSRAGEIGERLTRAATGDRLTIVEVPVDWADTERLVDVAGRIVAWGG